MLVMIFGVVFFFCIVNYVLRKIVDDNCEDSSFSFEMIEAVKRNFYMDDFFKLVRDEIFVI